MGHQNLKPSPGMDIVAMGDTGDANVVMLTLMLLLNLKPSHGTDVGATGDTGDANVEMPTLMLSLSLKLSHTTMYTILIIPTITLVKDLLMPSLTHGMDTGVANVAQLKLSHGDMEDMDTVDTGDKIKVEDGTNFPLRQNEKAYGSDNNKIVLIIGLKLF